MPASQVTDARATMALYRTQKSAWEDSLLTHKTPSLLTNTTPALEALDLSKISLTGVGKKRQQHLGLAATLRHEKHLREEAERGGSGDEDDDDEQDELVEDEKRKKRRVERKDDLVLGFDFEAAPVAPIAPPPAPAPHKDKAAGGTGASGKKKQKGAAGGAAARPTIRGDMSRRPVAKDSWWEED